MFSGLKRGAAKAQFNREVQQHLRKVAGPLGRDEAFVTEACTAIAVCYGAGRGGELMPGDWRVHQPTYQEFCNTWQLAEIASRRKAAGLFPFDDETLAELRDRLNLPDQ